MDEFFSVPLDQSVVKAAIVSKYFGAWANVMMTTVARHPDPKRRRIAYIDLFAGPGRYADGTSSTPVKVLERAITDEKLRAMLVTIFNDSDEANVRALEKTIAEIPGVEGLTHQPTVWHNTVGDVVVKEFEASRFVPTLFFVDPFGYKGLSLRLINSVLKDFGCDCIIFFNYNRINMGISNPKVQAHMEALFGTERMKTLKPELAGMSRPEEREERVVEALCEALRAMGGKYTLPFRFRHATKELTSHHLIFVSKHVRGYEIMKDIMARESCDHPQGVASFEYNPGLSKQGMLFELARPLDELGGLIAKQFSGRVMSVQAIYEAHHVGRRYIMKNYQDAIKALEESGRVETNRTDRHRKLNQLPPGVEVRFK